MHYFNFYNQDLTISQMFLQCTSYGKPQTSKQRVRKEIHKRESSPQHNDQFVFSDFFIRKNPMVTSQQSINNSKYQNCSQRQGFLYSLKATLKGQTVQRQQSREKESKILIVPTKKTFQIKFLSHNNKNALLKNITKNENYIKFDQNRHLIQGRRIRPNISYTPQISTRYFNDNRPAQQNYLSKTKQLKNSERRSFQMSQSKVQDQNQGNNDKLRYSLMSSQNIKGLILGRNPKAEAISKSNKFMKLFFQKKQSKVNVQTTRAFSEKQKQIKMKSIGSTGRVHTQSKNKNGNNFELPFQPNQTSRKSVKLNGFLHYFNDQIHSKQVIIQPWAKYNEDDPFNDSIQQIGADLSSRNQNKMSKDPYFDEPARKASSVNPFRKIYSGCEKGKVKATIRSQK